MTDPWRPITTAPMYRGKGPRVDLWVEPPHAAGYRVTDAFWSGGIWKIETIVGFHIRAYSAQHTATFWMLPPKPPGEGA